uniref:F-box domain-containing protein n=1 Tax=Tetradesmus obliquus TaxID=3088 RepID=A0A383WGQ2_TETOB|eukprot:jgi/Sobl393_1/11235/SZX76665.1
MRILKDVGDVLSVCIFGGTAKGLRRMSSLSLRCASPGVAEGWADVPHDCLVAIIEKFSSKNDAAVMRCVCRAWRDGFDATVKCVTLHSNVALLPQSPSRFPNMQHLVVSHCSHSGAQAAIHALALPAAHLSVLELSHSMLSSVPPDLHQLAGLRTLVLSSNRLKELRGAKLHMLPQLEHLDLSCNLLGELPASIGSLGRTLRKLNVSENSLPCLPEGLGGLTQLRSLRASNNLLLELPDSLAQLQSLTLLDLSLNRLKSMPDNFTRLTQLHHLGLFAAFSHSLRNEGSATVRVLAQLSMTAPEMHLQAEDRLLALIKIRCKQLRLVAEQQQEAEEARAR